MLVIRGLVLRGKCRPYWRKLGGEWAKIQPTPLSPISLFKYFPQKNITYNFSESQKNFYVQFFKKSEKFLHTILRVFRKEKKNREFSPERKTLKNSPNPYTRARFIFSSLLFCENQKKSPPFCLYCFGGRSGRPWCRISQLL